MPLEVTVGEEGDKMTLLRADNGRLTGPLFLPEAVNNIKTVPLREDDIMLCSFSKSGCHWTWEILRCLVHGKTEEKDLTPKEKYMMEFNPQSTLDTLPSPRILNNHFHFDDQPSDLLIKKPKIVYVYRNIKDVAVSFYYHVTGIRNSYFYNGNFSAYLKRFAKGFMENDSVFEYMRGWDKAIQTHPELDVHVISFENLNRNTLEEIRRLSQFLGTSDDEAFLKSVREYTSIGAMRQRKGHEEYLKNKDGKHVMYRKGKIGDWKNHFTVAENEMMDQLIQSELSDLKLHKFIYE